MVKYKVGDILILTKPSIRDPMAIKITHIDNYRITVVVLKGSPIWKDGAAAHDTYEFFQTRYKKINNTELGEILYG